VPDALNRIIQVTPPNGDTTQTVYTPAGRVASVTTPSGLVSSTSYDQAGRIVTLTHKQNAAPVASYAYGYDTNGNRVEQDETNGGMTEVTTYGYDDDDRLTDVTYPDRTAHYDLDGVGNRTQETQTDPASHAQIRQVTATFNTRDCGRRSFVDPRADPGSDPSVSPTGLDFSQSCAARQGQSEIGTSSQNGSV